MSEFPAEFLPNKQKTIGEEPDPPRFGWVDGGVAPTDADYCPACDELVEHANQIASFEIDGQRWHKDCRKESEGYEKIDDGPRCRNCNGEFDLRRVRENPLPDLGGVVVEHHCTTFGNHSASLEDHADELTDADIEYLNRVVNDDEHWFYATAHLLFSDVDGVEVEQ